MEYVALGRGGPRVSAVGVGMWQAGGKSWGKDVRDPDCRKAMARAVELGLTGLAAMLGELANPAPGR